MKRSIMLGAAIVLMLVFVTAHASPKKTNPPAPSNKIPSPSAGAAVTLSGKVVETMNGGGYTYISLEKNGKKTWVAVPEIKVTVGQEIALQPGQEMRNFASKSLNRTFDSIIFSAGPVSQPVAMDAEQVGEKHAGSKAAVVKSDEKISVEKASGPDACTIAEIFARRSKLNKKTAVVKAKVMKVSAGIMGKNWIHLQDGTGDAAKGTNNLVATSQDLPAQGEIVTMKGTIYKDKDFGAGYKYSVIMEQATIQR